MDLHTNEEQPIKKNFNYTALIFIGFLILALTLPFHYFPTEFSMFPKDNLTLKNTFIFNSDIDTIVSKYNKASNLEKIQLRQDPFIKRMFDKGYLVDSTVVNTK